MRPDLSNAKKMSTIEPLVLFMALSFRFTPRDFEWTLNYLPGQHVHNASAVRRLPRVVPCASHPVVADLVQSAVIRSAAVLK